jgi:hypothetical protein
LSPRGTMINFTDSSTTIEQLAHLYCIQCQTAPSCCAGPSVVDWRVCKIHLGHSKNWESKSHVSCHHCPPTATVEFLWTHQWFLCHQSL